MFQILLVHDTVQYPLIAIHHIHLHVIHQSVLVNLHPQTIIISMQMNE
jgi:hypothetical protein